MKGKVLQKIIAMINIITLTMVNFVSLGSSLISYAEDTISTNHKNINFEVYFKNENGEKNYSNQDEISKKDIKLYASIEIKQEGYFNGKISLGKSNFNINSNSKDLDINKNYIEKIENNEITLNQIKAGEKVELELLVNPIRNDSFNIELLNMQSEVKLSGIYKDSTQKDIEIEATRNVLLYLNVNKDPNPIQLGAEVITNQILKVSGENKRVIQVLVNSGLENNVAPIKSTKIEVGIPVTDKSKIEEVEAYGVTLDATNSALEGNLTEKLTKDEQTGNVSILLENNANQNNEVEWKKTGNDQIIFTFICKEDAETIESKLRIETEINVYSSNNLSANAWYEIENITEKSGIVISEIKNAEDNIYKGKIYAGIEREYQTKTNVNISFPNIVNSIDIKENAGDYYKDNQKIKSNNLYLIKTTFNKNNIIDMLGENALIEIYDQNDVKLSEINSQTETNEKGNIEVNYQPETTTSIEIRTNAPIKQGKISYINNKIIKSTDYKIAENANKIITTLNTRINSSDWKNAIETIGTINLEESNSEVNMSISKDSLYTTTEDNNIDITSIFKTNSEANNLYKNPQIVYTFPEEVKEVELIEDAKLLYEDELKIKSATVEGKQIIVQLEGEQTKYNEYETKDIEGATIILKVNTKLDKTAISSTKKITMKYTNEKDQKDYEEIGSDINIVAPQELITINNIDSLNIETQGDEEQKEVDTTVGKESKELEVKGEIINNKGEEINDVKIVGSFPTDGNIDNNEAENNMGVIVKTPIETNQKVYYTENANATDEIENEENQWTEDTSNILNAKKYLIKADNVGIGDKINVSYKIQIPENLEYNKQASQGYKVNYVSGITGVKETKQATSINLTTGKGPTVEANLSASVGQDEISDNSSVKNGEVIKYNIHVKNTGSEVANNINVVGNIPEGTKGLKTVTEQIDGKEYSYQYIKGKYYEETEEKEKVFEIETLQPGEEKNLEYEVRVDTKANSKIINSAKVNYNDISKETNSLTCIAEDGKIRISVKSDVDPNANIEENSKIIYEAIIENISDSDIDNIQLKWNIPSEYQITYQMIDDEDVNSNDSTLKINSIKKGEKAVIYLGILVGKVDKSKQVDISAILNCNNTIYRSNIYKDNIIANNTENTITMSSENENGYVETGDIINYNVRINNKSDLDKKTYMTLYDKLPSELSPVKYIIDGKETDLDFLNRDLEIQVEVEANKSKDITIQAVVNKDETREKDVRISNSVYWLNNDKQENSNTISHIIEAEKKENGSSEGTSGDDEQNNPSDGTDSDEDTTTEETNEKDNETSSKDENNINKNTYKINGIAWIDENSDGQMQDSEKLCKDITVKLIDINTNKIATDINKKEIIATTDDKGFYTLSGILQGKYIVIFEYDSTKYVLSTYKKDGINESKNSDVVSKKLNIDGTEKTYAVTDTIEIKNESISSINIGLVEAKTFDLKLNKYVNKIIVQNSDGTKVYEYNNETLAKIELDAKKINNSTVIIEYKIEVTNDGQVGGYITNIVDYAPKGMTFSSELNRDWYQSEQNLYNKSLSNDKIEPGETKNVTLLLTKTMTENNTGLINNTAEIASAYNEQDIKDINSTPGNNVKNENDQGSTDVIISIRTGAAIIYTTIIIAVLVIIGSTIYIIKKNNLKTKI